MGFEIPIQGKPVIGFEDESVVLAATVAAHGVDSHNRPYFRVLSWQAGRGQEALLLSPAEFATWRRMFVIPESKS